MTDYLAPQVPPDTHLLSRIVCWFAILLTIGSVAVRVQLTPPAARSSTTGEVDNTALRTAAKAAVGTHAIQASLANKAQTDSKMLMANVDAAAHSPREQICAAVVAGEIVGLPEALARIAKIDPQKNLAVSDDLDAFTELYADGPDELDSEVRDRLIGRYEWYGELALVSHLPIDDPRHQAVVDPSRITMILLTAVGLVFIFLALAGLVTLIVAGAFVIAGRFPSMLLRILPSTSGGKPVFLEAFAIYIVLFILFGELLGRFVHPRTFAWYFVSTILLPIVMIWPVLRGMRWSDVRAGFGYAAPRGLFREPFMGIIGYIAGLPVVILGFYISLRLSHFAGATPSHPIVNELRGSASQVLILYILACVWAPIMEETMFRGALLAHLRARWSWLLSSIVVGILFALVHPQGWTFVPALGSIGMVLCWIREWRGSIIGSMTAHALNNAAVLSLALLLLR